MAGPMFGRVGASGGGWAGQEAAGLAGRNDKSIKK